MIVDTHAHLTDSNFENCLDDYLDQARAAGVGAILSVGTTLASSRQCVALAERYPMIRASVGIHPNHCHEASAGDWGEVERLCSHPRVAALGETGLDRYWDDCPWDVQVDYFRRHIRLGQSTRLPIVVHTRESAQETLDVLRAEASSESIRGVMHSFTGPMEVAEGCLELGLYLSFAGMVTFKNAPEIREIARATPDDRILVETDSPYLTPHPFRGKRPNHPALVVHTATLLSELRGVSLDDFSRQTTENAQRLFSEW